MPSWPPIVSLIVGALIGGLISTLFGFAKDVLLRGTGRRSDWYRAKDSEVAAVTQRLQAVEYLVRDADKLRQQASDEQRHFQEDLRKLQGEHFDLLLRLARLEEGTNSFRRMVDEQILPLLQAHLQRRLRS